MTTLSRFAFASLALIGLVVAALGARDSHAAALYTVSLTPPATTVPIGSDATFAVRLETTAATLPGLVFDVQGGVITGIVSPNVVSPGVATGAVHVTREMPGTAHLTASFAGQVLATSDLTFAQVGAVVVTVATDVTPDAAARTWRYEVVDTSGAVVDKLTVGTSGDAPRATATTRLLPYGYYTVRQVLGSDTKLACGSGAFYQVTGPVSGATTLELSASRADASFTIHLCDGAPAATQVDIPIDTVQPPAAGGVLGDALPGEPPINEVRGVRQAGPGEVLPPNAGSGSEPGSPVELFLILAGAFLCIATPPLALVAAKVSRQSNR
jgi:hypothetical protein